MKTFLFLIPFILIGMPYILSVMFYKYNFNKYEQHWRAIHFSVAASVIFYLVAVVLMVYKLFELNVTGYVFISAVLFIIIILIIQYRKTEEVHLKQALKLLSRIFFMIFFCAYFVLLIYAMIKLVQFVWPIFF